MPKVNLVFLLLDLFLFLASCGVYAWQMLRRVFGRQTRQPRRAP